MTRPVVYIASPYGLDPTRWAANVDRQERAAAELIRLGYAPIAPLLGHYVQARCLRAGEIAPRYDEWIEVDLALVAKCDMLLRLPGESRRADDDLKCARVKGIDWFWFDPSAPCPGKSYDFEIGRTCRKPTVVADMRAVIAASLEVQP